MRVVSVALLALTLSFCGCFAAPINLLQHKHNLRNDEGCTDFCHHLTSGPCQHPDEGNEVCFEMVFHPENNTHYCPAGSVMCGVRPSRPGPSNPDWSMSIAPPVVDWGFENGNLDAWTKEGTAFDDQPVFGDNPTARNRGQPSNHVGDYWIGTYEKYQGLAGETAGSRQGDSVTGVITSPEFTITEQFVSFLVGGGAHAGTSGQFNRGTFVSLLVGSEEVFRQTGFNHETMRRVSHDISAYMGRRAVIKIVDMESGGWGHINCDDFLWYTPTSTASVSPVPSTTPSASATASTTPSASATASPAVIDWGFESRTLDAWTKEGTAFDSQPTFGDNPTARNRGQPSNHVGHSWIGTYERYQGLPNERAGVTQGDHPTGIITSPEFTITSSSVSFLVGGGAHAGTSGQFNRGTFVSLLVGSEEVFRQPGFNHETMRRVTKDISAYMGRTAVVKIVDMESGGWGHINCDDFIWS